LLQVAKIRSRTKSWCRTRHNDGNNIAVILNAVHRRDNFGYKWSGQSVALTWIVQSDYRNAIGDVQ
jgi:hypothetical protein